MRYLSIDTETTSLSPVTGQILSIGIILEDSKNKLSFEEIPKLQIVILHEEIYGEPFALNMNKDIIQSIVDYKSCKTNECRQNLQEKLNCVFVSPEYVAKDIRVFLFNNGFDWDFNVLNVAGKNFATFDKAFLENQIIDWSRYFKIHQRVLDPANLFVDWQEDSVMPNLALCKSRIGDFSPVTHNALQDAFDVINLFRTKY